MINVEDFKTTYDALLKKHLEEEVLYIDICKSVKALEKWYGDKGLALPAASDDPNAGSAPKSAAGSSPLRLPVPRDANSSSTQKDDGSNEMKGV